MLTKTLHGVGVQFNDEDPPSHKHCRHPIVTVTDDRYEEKMLLSKQDKSWYSILMLSDGSMLKLDAMIKIASKIRPMRQQLYLSNVEEGGGETMFPQKKTPVTHFYPSTIRNHNSKCRFHKKKSQRTDDSIGGDGVLERETEKEGKMRERKRLMMGGVGLWGE
ncbi:hypothetical protein L1987_58528 [Smallanthus sonchifolius]|uniref:Uncharacterized protein n=1 Tax=Smallanthus sonchifolius TaxID=185202 RepID=A0ACB9DG14_9ASTR|nr:hypothetical protein L1987_58528 [Smallanthus sonchifolius]